MPRSLRLQVMQGSRLLDDRFITGDFVIGSETFVAVTPEGPVLQVAEGMSGELALDGRTPQLLSVQDQRLLLPETARGWVKCQGLTIYLQFEATPPPVPPALPPEVRAGFFGGLQKSFVAVLLAVISLEGAGVYVIHKRPYLEPDDIERSEPPPPVFASLAETTVERPAPRVTATPEHSAVKTPTAASKPAGTAPAPNAGKELATKMAERVLQDSGLDDVLGRSSAGGDDELQIALNDIHRPGTASTSPGFTSREKQEAGPVTGPLSFPEPRPLDPKRTKIGDRPVHPTPDIDLFPPSDPPSIDPSPDSADILRFFKSKGPAIRQCYEAQLKLEPSLHGKLEVTFSVGDDGRVSEMSVDTDRLQNENVVNCIRLRSRTWKVPNHKEGTVNVTMPLVFVPSS